MHYKLKTGILLSKPNLLKDIKALLPGSLREDISRYRNLALGEIAGRYSIAALIKAAAGDDIEAILPTLVYTGTEYGDWKVLYANVDFAREQIMKKYQKPLFDLVILGNPVMWWALNGRFASVLLGKFGFYSPCPGCHLYMHLIRVPLARELSCTKIIGGERESHGDKLKINQIPMALDAYTELLSFAGIELILPLRKIYSYEEIEALVGAGWRAGEKQLKCVFSSNYRFLDGSVRYDEDALRKYFDEFAIPAGKKILQAWQKGTKEIDYVRFVGSILAGIRDKGEV